MIGSLGLAVTLPLLPAGLAVALGAFHGSRGADAEVVFLVLPYAAYGALLAAILVARPSWVRAVLFGTFAAVLVASSKGCASYTGGTWGKM